jgi:hypothetical protein
MVMFGVFIVDGPLKMKGNEMADVTISEIEYKQLIESQKLLQALQDAGVDNWEGYGFACESLSDGLED